MFELSHYPPAIVVVDDFYVDPLAVREFALEQMFQPQFSHYKGQRTAACYAPSKVMLAFEKLLACPIKAWDLNYNGCFQLTTEADPLVFHADLQDYAGVVYLTPGAPPGGGGTSFWRSKQTGLRRIATDADATRLAMTQAELDHRTFDEALLDPVKWDLVDRIEGVFNRLVLWNARLIHSASGYWGSSLTTGRLVQLFFFNVT